MKIYKWLYPKDLASFRYWFHLVIIAVIFETLWLFIGAVFPQLFNFSMPVLTLNYYFSVLFSWMTVVIVIILGISDISAHSILKIN